MSDVIRCGRRTGISRGRLCFKCDGKCVACESYVNAAVEARVCEECAAGVLGERCVLCGGRPRVGEELVTASYCKQCVLLERDRDGCPRIANVHTYKDSSKQL